MDNFELKSLLEVIDNKQIELKGNISFYKKRLEDNKKHIDKYNYLYNQYEKICKDIKDMENLIKFLGDRRSKIMSQNSEILTAALKNAVDVVLPHLEVDYQLVTKSQGRNGQNYTTLKGLLKGTDSFVSLQNCTGDAEKQIISNMFVILAIIFSGKTPFVFSDETFNSIKKYNINNMKPILNLMVELGFQMIIIEQDDEIFNELENVVTYDISNAKKNNEAIFLLRNDEKQTERVD